MMKIVALVGTETNIMRINCHIYERRIKKKGKEEKYNIYV